MTKRPARWGAGRILCATGGAEFTHRTLDGRIFALNAQSMSRMKTLLLAGVILPFTAPAFASGPLHYVFAECVGRFSAEMEHAWLLGDDRADLHENRRHTFIALMEATMPSEAARDILAYRIDNKIAHAALLTTASFGQDERHAQRAKIIARTYRQSCEQLLLDS